MYVNMYKIDVCIQLHTCRRTSKWESCSTCSRVQLFNFAVRIKSRLAASLPFTVTATVKKNSNKGDDLIDSPIQKLFWLVVWWFGTWLLFSILYGMSSFPLANIFQRGWNHQPVLVRLFSTPFWFKTLVPRGPIVWLIITIPMVFIGALPHFVWQSWW